MVDTVALVVIACMSTIAGVAGIAVLVDMYTDNKKNATQWSNLSINDSNLFPKKNPINGIIA